MRHATDNYRYHECGGTILVGSEADSQYCDRCGAFAYDGEDVPVGTDRDANRRAFDDGEDCSPS